jgi:Fe2+ transport system protein FeoA
MRIKNNEHATLADLETETSARIVSVEGDAAVARRLLEMGVTPGAKVRVVKAAPFGCPIEIKVRNSHLAIRRADAAAILVNNES